MMALVITLGLLTLLSSVNAQFADSGGGTLDPGDDFVGGGVVGEADDRFIDSSAAAGGDGSFASPWNELSDVTGMGTGYDLYLKTNSVFEDQTINITWSGTVTNRAVVSTYCIRDGVGIRWAEGAPGCGERAEINGTWEADCVATNNCQVGAGEVPSNVYAPLVGIARVNGENLDYITVSSLRLTESAGGGLQNAALVNDTNKSIGLIIEDNVVHDMAFAGILFTKVDNSIARNNELYHLWACEKQTRTGGDATCDDAQPAWGGCVSFVRSPNAQSLIENNWIHSSICEGISVTLSDHVVVRGNSISNVHSSSIYGNHSANNVVENNITVGNRGGNEWWAPSGGFDTGFDGIGSWALEVNGQGTSGGGNLVRNNMTAGNQKCWTISNFNGTDPTDVQGADYYGNTCIGPISQGPTMAQSNFSQLISSQSSSNVIEVGAETACFQDPASDMSWSYNVWDVAQGSLDNDCEGANDVYSATIGLASTIGEAQAFNWVNFPTAADFELTSGSDAIGAGDPSLETAVCLDATDFGVGYTGINNGNPPNEASWEKCLYYDFENTVRDAAAPNAGALEGTTDVPGGEIIPENSDKYFVGTGGSDGNNGLTHATRWATMSQVNAAVSATSADVYLLSDSVFEDQELNVDWPGTSVDRAVIGTYCLAGSTPRVWTAGGTGCGGKAEINGTMEASCAEAGTCPFDGAGAVPLSRYNGLVRVTETAPYTTIRNLSVRDSSGEGIEIDGNRTVPMFAIVENNDVFRSMGAQLALDRLAAGDGSIMRNNYAELGAMVFWWGYDSIWPTCITANTNTFTNSNVLIENNVVTECGGEGIGLLRVGQNIVRGNQVSNTRRVLLYLDNAADNVVENNQLYGTGLSDGRQNGVGMAVSVESYSTLTDSVRNVIRNNIIANVEDDGISMSIQNTGIGGDPTVLGLQVGAKFYGNTVLYDGGTQSFQELIEGNNLTVNNNVDYIEFASNIFSSTNKCGWPSLGANDDWGHNAWSVTPSDADCVGTNDVVGNVDIAFDWTTVNGSNLPAVSDFELGASSVALGAGDPSLDTEVCLSAATYGDAFTSINNGNPPNQTNWEKCLYYDFNGNLRDPVAPNAGAIETAWQLDSPYIIVSTTGTDGPSCGTLASPCRNPEYAIQQASPGHTVYVRSGTYYDHDSDTAVIRLGTGDSGTAGAYIDVKPYPGETVSLNGDRGGANSASYVVFSIGTDYIRFTGFTMEKATADGIYVGYGGTVGAGDPSTYNEFVGNTIRNNGPASFVACDDGGGKDGVFISQRAGYTVLDRNIIHSNGRPRNPACDALSEADNDTYRHDHGIYAQGYKTWITNNVFYDHAVGYHIKADGYMSDRTTFSYPVLWPDLAAGEFSVWIVGNTFGPNTNLNPYNNSSGSPMRPFNNNPSVQNSARWYFANNLILDVNGSESAVLITNTFPNNENGTDGNVCENNIAQTASGGTGFSRGMCGETDPAVAANVSTANNTFGQSLSSFNMTDPATFDYRISAGSSAENTGKSLSTIPDYTLIYSPILDKDGAVRGDPPEAGAFEVQ